MKSRLFTKIALESGETVDTAKSRYVLVVPAEARTGVAFLQRISERNLTDSRSAPPLRQAQDMLRRGEAKQIVRYEKFRTAPQPELLKQRLK
jgi:hypothetical protein